MAEKLREESCVKPEEERKRKALKATVDFLNHLVAPWGDGAFRLSLPYNKRLQNE